MGFKFPSAQEILATYILEQGIEQAVRQAGPKEELGVPFPGGIRLNIAGRKCTIKNVDLVVD